MKTESHVISTESKAPPLVVLECAPMDAYHRWCGCQAARSAGVLDHTS